MEENFSMEGKMGLKTFSMEWKKIASMEYGKIVFHSMPCTGVARIVDRGGGPKPQLTCNDVIKFF